MRTSKTFNGAIEQYTWDLAEGLPVIIQDGTTRYLTGPDGLPIEQVDGSGNVQYYIQDQLGSTRGLLDTSGNVAGSYTFTPYGEVKGHSEASTPFGYAGQYTDSESGLQYLRARYYDPSNGQFLTMDPMLNVTMEPYGYVGGNLMNVIDPMGLGCSFGPVSLPFGATGSCVSQAAKHAGTAVGSVVDNCGTISAARGGASLVAIEAPPVSATLGTISLATGLCATVKDATEGKVGATALDAIAVVPGVGSVVKAVGSQE